MIETAQTPKLSIWRRKPWVMFVILCAICSLPIIAAWLLYLNIDNMHLDTGQYVEFIHPARALQTETLPLPMASGSLAPDYFNGRLTMVYISAAFCNADCEEALILMRQTRLALGPKIESAQRLYLVEGRPGNPAKLHREQPGLTVADVASATGRNFIRQFSPNGDSVPDIGKYIYLVNPRGFYIMRYSISGPPEDLLKNLQRLLGQDGRHLA